MSKTYFDFWKEGYSREQVRKMYANDLHSKILYGGYYGIRDVMEKEGLTRHTIVKTLGLTKQVILDWHMPMLNYFVDIHPNVTMDEMVCIFNENNFLSRTGKPIQKSLLSQLGFSFVRKKHERQKSTEEWDNIHSWFLEAIKNGCQSHQEITNYLNEHNVKNKSNQKWKRSNFSMFVVNHPEYDWTFEKTKEYRTEFIEQLKKDLLETDFKKFKCRRELSEYFFEKYKDNKNFGFNISMTFINLSLMDLEVHIKKHESYEWQNWFADLKNEIQKYYRSYGWLPKLQIIGLLNRNEFPNRDGKVWHAPSLYRLINNFDLNFNDLYVKVLCENIDLNKSLGENVDFLNLSRYTPISKRLWSEEMLKDFVLSHLQNEKGDSD